MNILILGSGGREHALAWKLHQSPKVNNLYIAPGNGGTKILAANLPLDINDAGQIKTAILEHQIDMLVIGPEEPLVKGVVDRLKSDQDLGQLLIIGPSAEGAQLEGSKQFAKDFMNKYGIPTGQARVFNESNISEGYKFLETQSPPYVLKADGLAAGKGVLITEDINLAKSNLEELIIRKKFGDSSTHVLIEEFLSGIELSVFVLTDGQDYVILPEAKDYKRIGENDTGPNTGGMGAVSPVGFADHHFMHKVEERIIKPTIKGIREEHMDFHGFVFFGLINKNGDPYVIEYNVRMGDPETEVVIPRINSDLADLLVACATSQLKNAKIDIAPFTATTIMTVSEGYPNAYQKGYEISIENELNGALVFHAGTKYEGDKLVTNGGRVIAVSCLGKNMSEALAKCYHGVDKIHWKGKNFRPDIGFDLKALGQ